MKVLDLTKLRELAGLPVTEGYMISGDWQNLDIDHDDLEIDDAFPGDSVWSVGRGGAPSKYFYFTSQNTSDHFATIVDMGRGTFKVEDETGKTISGPHEYRRNRGAFGLSWGEAEAKVAELLR